MTTAVFYHAGCPVCSSAELMLVKAIDPIYQMESVHLGEHKDRIREAERSGVKSVPAIVLNGQAFHINFGASIDDLKH